MNIENMRQLTYEYNELLQAKEILKDAETVTCKGRHIPDRVGKPMIQEAVARVNKRIAEIEAMQ